MTRLSMATTPTPDAGAPKRGFRSWDQGQLPDAPVFEARNWTGLIGPSLLMAGASIGAGEWLLGPLVTAQYGGTVLWLATIAIFCQVGYNLGVMRYSLYTGESVLVGFLRTRPGLRFWTAFYLVMDFGSLWPYLAANAAVPLAAVILGRLPGDEDGSLVRTLSYAIFLTGFVPLIFGGKIYNSLQRVMVTKLTLVLLYLGFLALFFTGWTTKWEILSGFTRFGALPSGDFNWATLAAFAAVSGSGGLSNLNFSSLVRDRGWGMGAQVGALPSAIGGRTIQLSHNGKVFQITAETLKSWREWIRTIRRDQFVLWAPSCILGMALPAMLSYEFIQGVENVPGNAAAAMIADGIAARHGQVFWFLTLLCGFIILAPSQVTNVDSICRRWTDVIWMGARQLRHLPGHQVKFVYYGLLTAYCIWGMIALRLTPDPVVLAIGSGVLFNFAMGFSSLHLLFMTHKLLPKQLQLPWFLRILLVFCALFYITISTIALRQQWPNILEWLGS